jgi:hypothetical protein
VSHWGTYLGDRRNYRHRAETVNTVIESLLCRGGLSDTDDLRSVSTSAVKRILRRLAARGLARYAAGQWIPSPVLLHAPALTPCAI